MQLNVLHVYSGNMYGGLERLLVTLAQERELCPNLSTAFALCFEGRLSSELQASGVPVYLLGSVRFSRPWTVLRARKHLRQLLEQRAFDAVICHECWAYSLAGGVISQTEAAAVFWMHGWGVGNRWYEVLSRRHPPALAIATSHFAAQTLPAIFPNREGRVLYPPVPTPTVRLSPEERLRLRQELDTAPESVAIATTSRLAPYKGHVKLAEALVRLKSNSAWVWWVAGGVQDPKQQEYLDLIRAAVVQGGIEDRVRFLGERRDIPSILFASDIHCQPNTGGEPFGIAFVEALHAGLPVVSSQIGGAMEIIDESCGLLVEPGDTEALAEALSSLIQAPERRHHLGQAGIERAKQLCDPARTLERLHQLLAEVCQDKSNVDVEKN